MDVNIRATAGHSTLQGAHEVRPITVAHNYSPADTTPDALSRLLREVGAEEDAKIDEEIPSFGDQQKVQPEPSHCVQVVTSARSGKAPSNGAAKAVHKGHTTLGEI